MNLLQNLDFQKKSACSEQNIYLSPQSFTQFLIGEIDS